MLCHEMAAPKMSMTRLRSAHSRYDYATNGDVAAKNSKII